MIKPGADIATRQMLNKPPLPFTKGLRLGNMPQIRTIVDDEELESVWTGKENPQQALDAAVERGISCCAASAVDEIVIPETGFADGARLRGLRSAPNGPGKVNATRRRTQSQCHHPVRCSARAGCRTCWSRRSWSSPLSFYLACGRSAVVLAAERRSVWSLQPVCRPDNFSLRCSTTRITWTPSGRR